MSFRLLLTVPLRILAHRSPRVYFDNLKVSAQWPWGEVAVNNLLAEGSSVCLFVGSGKR